MISYSAQSNARHGVPRLSVPVSPSRTGNVAPRQGCTQYGLASTLPRPTYSTLPALKIETRPIVPNVYTSDKIHLDDGSIFFFLFFLFFFYFLNSFCTCASLCLLVTWQACRARRIVSLTLGCRHVLRCYPVWTQIYCSERVGRFIDI